MPFWLTYSSPNSLMETITTLQKLGLQNITNLQKFKSSVTWYFQDGKISGTGDGFLGQEGMLDWFQENISGTASAKKFKI